MTANEIASFSISLKVKDIAASKQFYEKLGFEQIPGAGGVDQKWMVMKTERPKWAYSRECSPKTPSPSTQPMPGLFIKH